MSDQEAIDRRWLDAAARLAMPALGTTGPSPTVGAVLVDPKTNLMLGRAVTPGRGATQAESLAIADAEGPTQGSTLYLTLEPAAQDAMLAPVIGQIVEAGIARVVVGELDPEGEQAGKGLKDLADSGIETLHLPHEPSHLVNEGFAMRVTKGRPFVTLKITVSVDGKVGHAQQGQLPPIGVEAQRFVERERAAADAVMSGIARAEIEDNDLSVHLEGLTERNALRVVLAGNRDINPEMDIFFRPGGAPILVVTSPDRPVSLRRGIEVVEIEGRRGHPDLRQVLSLLADRGINRVFVEAGARVAETFIAHELIDRLFVIDSAVEVGRFGIPAALLGRFQDRITAARYSEVDRFVLGEDNVRVFVRGQDLQLPGKPRDTAALSS